MRIGVIIPDRNDRPEFLENCMRMMKRQTLQPVHIELVNFEPENDSVDITKRYRIGYEALQGKQLDVIAFIENDDWYHSDYFRLMTNAWRKNGCPDLFGTSYTIYYHVFERKWFTFEHFNRSSAMSTFIKPGLDLTWPVDHDPYTDVHLWLNVVNHLTWTPDFHVCLGMKHGVGKCGGQNHFDEMHRYKNDDFNFNFLKSTVDDESLMFYTTRNERVQG